MFHPNDTWRGRNRGVNAGSAAAVIALHVGALALLAQLDSVRNTLKTAVPIMVELISRAPVTPDTPPKPLPVKPAVTARPIAKPQPVLTAPPDNAPAAVETPPPARVDAPAESVKPAPIAAAPTPPASVPASAPLVEPRFDASYLNNPAPQYPALSRRTGEEGKVILRVFVNERGLPDEVQIKATSGFSRLDTAALESVRHWKFVPARRGETAVGAWVLVPVSFNLRSS